MAISLVGQAGVNWPGNAGSSQVISYTSTGGNTLILTFGFDNPSTAPSNLTITDSASNTWHYSTSNANNPPYAQASLGGTPTGSFIAWCIGANAVTSVTISLTNQDQWQGTLSEWSGIVSLDTAAATGTGSGTGNFSSPSITLGNAGDLVVGHGEVNAGVNTVSPGSTFSTDNPNSCYALPGATGAFSFTWTTSGNNGYVAAVAAFSPSGGGTPHTATASLTVTPGHSAGRTRGRYRTGTLGVTPSFHAARSGGVQPVVIQQGSWWGLDTVFKQSRQEFEAYVSRPPMACPKDGEPLTYAPATKAGSGVERYCKYCGFQYPRDWTPPSRPMPW